MELLVLAVMAVREQHQVLLAHLSLTQVVAEAEYIHLEHRERAVLAEAVMHYEAVEGLLLELLTRAEAAVLMVELVGQQRLAAMAALAS
jgi:hypothetical protein